MGNQRFRLSDMIPNAWFYKLRDMNTTISHSHTKIKALPSPYSSTSNANSFNYTPRVHQFHTSPTSRKSLTKRTIIHKPTSSNHALIQLTESARANQDLFLSPTTNYVYESALSKSTQLFEGLPTTSCSCSVIDSSTSDIVIDFNEKVYNKKIQDSSGFDLIQDIEFKKLPPIITKPEKSKNTSSMVEKKEETCCQSSVSIKMVEENISKKETTERKPVSGVKIGSNSSKTAVSKRVIRGNDRKIFKSHKNKKRNFSDSCAIVKSSFDPQKDFKESMVEMIVENNIWESKDLDDLLARYLALNSDEYHDTIVKAFEQIC